MRTIKRDVFDEVLRAMDIDPARVWRVSATMGNGLLEVYADLMPAELGQDADEVTLVRRARVEVPEWL